MSTSFYAAPTLRRFVDLARADVYAPVPGDHYVVVTDVIGSTEAVRAGRYREVNYVGAASIAAVLNATDHADIPFVFGADGADGGYTMAAAALKRRTRPTLQPA